MAKSEIKDLQTTIAKLLGGIDELTKAVKGEFSRVGRPRKNTAEATDSKKNQFEVSEVIVELGRVTSSLGGAAQAIREAKNSIKDEVKTTQDLVRGTTSFLQSSIERREREAKQREAERIQRERQRNTHATLMSVGDRFSRGLVTGGASNIGAGLTAGIGRFGMGGAIAGGVMAIIGGVVEGLVNTIKSVFSTIKGVFDWVLSHMANLADLIKLQALGTDWNSGKNSSNNYATAYGVKWADERMGTSFTDWLNRGYALANDPNKAKIFTFSSFGTQDEFAKAYRQDSVRAVLDLIKSLEKNLGKLSTGDAERAIYQVSQVLGVPVEYNVLKRHANSADEFYKNQLNYSGDIGGLDVEVSRQWVDIRAKWDILSKKIGATWGGALMPVFESIASAGLSLQNKLANNKNFKAGVDNFAKNLSEAINWVAENGGNKINQVLGYLTSQNGLLNDFGWLKTGIIGFADVLIKIADYIRNSWLGKQLGIDDVSQFKGSNADLFSSTNSIDLTKAGSRFENMPSAHVANLLKRLRDEGLQFSGGQMFDENGAFQGREFKIKTADGDLKVLDTKTQARSGELKFSNDKGESVTPSVSLIANINLMGGDGSQNNTWLLNGTQTYSQRSGR